MERVPVPSNEEMAKAKNKDILKNLKDVDEGVIKDFEETAKLLTDYHDGDSMKALCVALAYGSGKSGGGSSSNKSLLTS
jgi:hypothetical protein